MHVTTLDIDHDPDEILDYSFDYGAQSALVTGETIVTSVWTTTTNVTISGGTHTDTTTNIWVDSVVGTTLSITLVNTITTSDGRTYERTMIVPVQDKTVVVAKAKATILNIVVEQGANFLLALTWFDTDGKPTDLTSYTASLIGKDAAGATVLTWTEASEITLGGTAGTITIAIDDSVTTAYTFDELTYCLNLTSPASFTTRVRKGTITLDTEC